MAENFQVIIHAKAAADYPKLVSAGLDTKLKTLLEILRDNPFQVPPSYEKLSCNLKGKYSRRINHTHKLLYEVDKEHKIVKVLSIWSHYER